MSLLRVTAVVPLPGFRLRLTLTDGSVIERDVGHLLVGPVFERVRHADYLKAFVEDGGVAWPGGADICADTLIYPNESVWQTQPAQHASVDDMNEPKARE